jgi:hypothetical protein
MGCVLLTDHVWGQALLQHKLVFIETRNARETSLALRNFQTACDSGYVMQLSLAGVAF